MAKPLRIVHVIGRLALGGAERHFVSLANAMSGEKTAAVFVGNRCDPPNLYAELALDIEQADNPVRKRSWPIGVVRLGGVLRKLSPDVVHCHLFWPSLYGTMAARLAGVPVVMTTEHGENRWKKPVHRWLERNVISRAADLRLCVSPQILVARRDLDGVPAEKLRVIANGTPVPERSARGSGGPELVVGSVGRVVKEKNFPLLVRSVGQLRSAGMPVRLCIVGDGPMMPGLRQTVAELGLEDAVELPGFRTDVDAFLDRFDVFASSSDQEGQPVALLEAMAWGLPCVATDVGAVSQTLDGGSEGIIVPPGDVERLAGALKRLAEDGELRRNLGDAARRRVQRDFSIDAVARTHLDIYHELLARKGIDIARESEA